MVEPLDFSARFFSRLGIGELLGAEPKLLEQSVKSAEIARKGWRLNLVFEVDRADVDLYYLANRVGTIVNRPIQFQVDGQQWLAVVYAPATHEPYDSREKVQIGLPIDLWRLEAGEVHNVSAANTTLV